jgi:hypothetical protein
MKTVEHFTPEELAKYINYDPATGAMTWAVKWWRRNKGDEVRGAAFPGGYHAVCFKGKRIFAHRVAWALYYGAWPKGPIDHINRDRKDNRIENLRVVTLSQNRINTKTMNRHGLLGVALLPHGRWQAQSGIGGSYKYLGTFDTKELAHQAYVEYVSRNHAQFLPKEPT